MDGDDFDGTLAMLATDWETASDHVRANARSLATGELRDIFRFRDTRHVPAGSAPVGAAIDLAAQALVANIRVTHPVVLGRLLLLLAPLLDPRFPMRATGRP